MKATGIIRRIDDLGRIVIPKEVRRTLHIREGDPMELYTTNRGEIVVKKYNATAEPHIKNICKALFTNVAGLCGFDNVAIYDISDMRLSEPYQHFFFPPVVQGVEEYFAHEDAKVIPVKADYDVIAYLVIRGECNNIEAVNLLVKMAEAVMTSDD